MRSLSMELGRDEHSWFQATIGLKTPKGLVWKPENLGHLPRSGFGDLSQDTPDFGVRQCQAHIREQTEWSNQEKTLGGSESWVLMADPNGPASNSSVTLN